MLNHLLSIFSTWLKSPLDVIMTHGTTLLVLGLSCYLINFITKQYLLKGIRFLSQKTKTTWDDFLLQNNVFDRLAHIAPAVLLYISIPIVYIDLPLFVRIVMSLCQAYMILITILVIDESLKLVELAIEKSVFGKKIAFRSYIQLLKLILYFIAGISILSVLLNKNPFFFLSGIGALTAVLMLVFKDTILGFVASIQLSANNMVKPGDWIEMPEFGADGDVLEVGLTSVKIQNWDKTVTTIPTYNLVSHSFKNWRGMSESGGRRIKRSITIDMNTVQFCTNEMIERYKKIQLIHDYIHAKIQEVSDYNQKNNIDTTQAGNGRHLTNLGSFRAYLVEYLKHHPKVHQKMTLIVRQLQPTEKGISIELYFFSNDQNWTNYEGIQSDIFDHILAILPEFDLSVFQLASGHDFQQLNGTVSGSSISL